MVHIDFGVSAFRREAFAGIAAGVTTDLSIVHQSLIEQRQLLAYETSHRFYEVGSPEGLQEFESFVRSGTLDLLTREAL
jgi:NDP-sugar pyrophosphorylase family protein